MRRFAHAKTCDTLPPKNFSVFRGNHWYVRRSEFPNRSGIPELVIDEDLRRASFNISSAMGPRHNDSDHRPRARGVRLGPATRSRGSVHPACYLSKSFSTRSLTFLTESSRRKTPCATKSNSSPIQTKSVYHLLLYPAFFHSVSQLPGSADLKSSHQAMRARPSEAPLRKPYRQRHQ